MTALADKIRSRGHWLVTLNPSTYVEERVPYGELYAIIERNAVNLRGWDFPHIDPHSPIVREANWIGQESDWNQYKEAWRFYQSGQFIDMTGLWEDWLDESSLQSRPEGWQPGKFLGVANTIFRFTEIHEFAARLAATSAGDQMMHIAVKISGLENRELRLEDPGRAPFMYPRKTSMKEFEFEQDITKVELLGQPRELALERLLRLFERFDWTPTVDQLRDWQSRIGK